jgi:hypothetical protein
MASLFTEMQALSLMRDTVLTSREPVISITWSNVEASALDPLVRKSTTQYKCGPAQSCTSIPRTHTLPFLALIDGQLIYGKQNDR